MDKKVLLCLVFLLALQISLISANELSTDFCFSDFDCNATSFCKFIIGACGGIGQCKTIPEECPLFYDPFCGCDGITYDNSCIAEANRMSIKHKGECINIECYTNSDCDDWNDFTYDYCENPGTIHSKCIYKSINCSYDFNCGDDGWINDLFCINNSIFRTMKIYTCNNPGTEQSFCSSYEKNIFKLKCGDKEKCVKGECRGGGNGEEGLKGKYYDRRDFTKHKMTRMDKTINFNWGKRSPSKKINPNTFSIRWTGQVLADFNETYTFYTEVNDGVRLWIDGNLIINQWKKRSSAKTFAANINLSKGWHDIRIDYFENTGRASIKLYYSSASVPKQIIPQENLKHTGN